jgi:hypothetical protein
MGGTVKRVHLKCRRCGFETRVEVLTRDDLEREPERPRGPVTCPQCGSRDVTLRD